MIPASFLGWVWCLIRLHVRAALGRQRYNVLGALNAVTHELVTELNTTYITATSVCALLDWRSMETRFTSSRL